MDDICSCEGCLEPLSQDDSTKSTKTTKCNVLYSCDNRNNPSLKLGIERFQVCLRYIRSTSSQGVIMRVPQEVHPEWRKEFIAKGAHLTEIKFIIAVEHHQKSNQLFTLLRYEYVSLTLPKSCNTDNVRLVNRRTSFYRL